jgi:hypothetical protein
LGQALIEQPIKDMEHKGIRVVVRILGVFVLLYSIVMIDVGIFGLRVFGALSADKIFAIYALTIMDGVLEAIASFGLMWVKKWGMICFYIFTAAAWCTSIASVLVGLVSFISALPSLVLITLVAFYLLYAQRTLFNNVQGGAIWNHDGKRENANLEITGGQAQELNYGAERRLAETLGTYVHMNKIILVSIDESEINPQLKEELLKSKGSCYASLNGGNSFMRYIDKDGNIAEVDLRLDNIASLSEEKRTRRGFIMPPIGAINIELESLGFTVINADSKLAGMIDAAVDDKLGRIKKEAKDQTNKSFSF